MGFSLLIQHTRELWKEWEMRFLVLLSLFLQLILATLVSRRKYKFRKWILIMIWTAYISTDSITSLALSIFSTRLANINETKGTIDPKSQIAAFWVPFLLLYLGGPDAITAFVPEDNELWLRQFVRLCIQVGLVGFIYYVALLRSNLSMLAAGMILVGLMKYAERILCLYLATKGQLRDSILSLPNFVPTYPRLMQQYNLKKEEGYWVEIDEVCEVPALEDFPGNSGQALNNKKATALFIAYELFKVSKLLFLGLVRNFSDLKVSRGMFTDQKMDVKKAFEIVEIELGFMYDLLYTKVPLLNCAWGITRWVVSLSMQCGVLVFFSLQDKKDYAKVDICITFLLISVAILLEIYSLLLAISSDWVHHWQLQRPGKSVISSAVTLLQFCPNQRWSNSVAQISLLGLSVRKKNRIFLKCPMLARLDEKLVIFYIDYKEYDKNIKKWIFRHICCKIGESEQKHQGKSWSVISKEVASQLRRSQCNDLTWSVREMEFDQSVLIWHVATELCYSRDRENMLGGVSDDIVALEMSKLVSRYMLYLMLFHPSMLPTGIGVLRYKETLVEIQKFFEGKLTGMSKNEGWVSSDVIKWAKKLFNKERHFHTGCKTAHKTRKSHYLCELCHLLLQMRTDRSEADIRRGRSRSVLYDACFLASQLNEVYQKWDVIGMVWAELLIYAACQCRGYEHCESLSRGGELLSHIWLLMAHLDFVEVVQTSENQRAAKLIKN